MSPRLLPLALVAFALASCGVKANLERPIGEMMTQTQKQPLQNPLKDPSLPPRPLGEPGGTTPPYTTGP
jgi:predicted small lipoprotein YifL